MDRWKSKRVSEKTLFLLYWLCQSLWLCGSQKTVEILKKMGIPDHLTCLFRNLYAGQEATVRTKYGMTHWFKIEQGVHQGCILLSCLFNLCAEYIMQNSGLAEALKSRLLGEISITSDMLRVFIYVFIESPPVDWRQPQYWQLMILWHSLHVRFL